MDLPSAACFSGSFPSIISPLSSRRSLRSGIGAAPVSPSLSTTSPTYHFLVSVPTAVTLSDFTASGLDAAVQINFSTASEIDLFGFNLYRSESLDGLPTRINPNLILAKTPGALAGNDYQFIDAQVSPGKLYYYWIELVHRDWSEMVGPAPAVVLTDNRLWLPLVRK